MWSLVSFIDGFYHMYYAKLVKVVHNVCFSFQDEITGEITRCCHPPLQGPLSDTLVEGSPAFEKLRKIVLNKAFQNGLAKAKLRRDPPFSRRRTH